MDISKDVKLLQWFANSDLAESTQRVYSMYMKLFCECVGKAPSELISESIIEIKAGLLPSERKEPEHFAKYKTCLKNKAMSPKSQSLAITCVRSFYKGYDIQLSANITKIKKPMPLRENMNYLSKEDIQKLITNCHSLRDKSIILCMVTSGMARQEILSLQMRDITFDDNNIGIVSVRRQKSQTDYTTFISPEAVHALKNYFEERNRIDKLKIKGQTDYVFVTYDNATHIDKGTFGKLFRTLAAQLGYKNGAYQIKSKSHALRKFFASTLENAGLPKNKIDFMLGHTPNSSDLAYFRYDIDKLKDMYKTYLPYLTFEKTIIVRSLNTEDTKRLGELEQENENLKNLVSSFKSDLESQKKTDETLAVELEKRMEELIEKRASEILDGKLKTLSEKIVKVKSSLSHAERNH
ncbi:MAG: tyrosine-type recombinase/integrase [Candidatus Methanoperedens sp.]